MFVCRPVIHCVEALLCVLRFVLWPCHRRHKKSRPRDLPHATTNLIDLIDVRVLAVRAFDTSQVFVIRCVVCANVQVPLCYG